jgi:AraC-like DNA-binding protein
MNYTSATLRRRLRSEGTSYQEIKDAVRRDTAIQYLSMKSMSIEEVAEKSGFSEPTSFFRAFKRWTGTSPRAYVASG